MSDGAPRWAGVVLLCAVGVHAAVDVVGPGGPARLAELLWCCHLATILIGVSVIVRWPYGIAAGFVFHMVIGLPLYVLDLAAGATTGSDTPTSAFVHLAAPLVGAWGVLRGGELPRYAWLGAWAIAALPLPISLLTDPALNINVVHQPWAPVRAWFESMWIYRAMNLALALFATILGDALLRRVRFARRLRHEAGS